MDQGMISHPSLHADGRWAAMSFAQQMTRYYDVFAFVK